MRRFLTISGLILLGLVLLVLAAVFILPKTGPGQALIDRYTRPIVENVVQKQLGSSIDYDRLHGGLPGEIILEDLSFTQNGEVWLEADRITLDWSPLALINRNIVIESLTAGTITLYQSPEMPERSAKEEDDGDGGRGFSLPSIEIGSFNVETVSIREPVFGDRYDLTIDAEASGEGRSFDLQAAIDTLSSSDSLRALIGYDGERLALDISVLSAPDGLLTTAAKAEDPVFLTLVGEGPLADWLGNIEAQLGNYGAVSGELGGDLEALQRASFALNIVPGTLLPDHAHTVAGETLHLEGRTEGGADGLTITLDEVTGRFGDLAGVVSLPEEDFSAVTADLSGHLSEAVAADYDVATFAGPVELQASMQRERETTAFEGRLSTAPLTLTVSEGLKRPGFLFEGHVDLDAARVPVENDRLAPILEKGAALRADLTVTEEKIVTAENVNGVLGRNGFGLSFGGEVEYSVAAKELDADLGGTVGREATEVLLDRKAFDGPVNYSVKGEGTLDDLATDLRLELPAGEYDGQAFTAGTLTADLEGLPRAPSGTVRLTSRDDSYQGRATLASRDKAITIRELAFTAGALSITGDGRYDRASSAANLTLALNAPERTTLLTGQTVSGEVMAELTYGGEGEPLDLDATVEELTYNEISIDQAQVTADGPLGDLNFSVNGRDADLPGVYLASAEIGGTAQLTGETRRIGLGTLTLGIEGDTEDNRITLLEPTTVTLGEAITLAPTSLDWIGNGQVTAEGRYGPDRWVADVSLTEVTVPRLTAPVTGTLALDTNAAQPATFSLRSSVSPEDEDATYDLTAEGGWTGQTVNVDAAISEGEDAPMITANIGWPVILTRTGGKLGVQLPDAPISGRINADGQLDPVYAFVPMVPPYLTGDVDGVLTLGGTAKALSMSGTINLEDGRFEEETLGVVLTELQGTAEFAYGGEGINADLSLVGAGADGRDGAVDLKGTLDIADGTSALDTRLVLTDATVVDSPTLKVRTGADLTASGALNDLTISGTIDIGQIDAAIPSLSGSESAANYPEVHVVRVDGEMPDEADIENGDGANPQIALDIEIIAQNEIFIRGRGLDSEWAANLDVTGTAASPVIDGEVRNRRGTFDFAGREFTIDRGTVTFERTDPELARLDARAKYTADDVTAYVNASGPISDPSLSLSSTPTLPDENIMAIVLFGKQPTELSALESLQIANALRTIAGVGPSLGGGGTGGLRAALGLDALSFGVNDSGEGVVAVGKYLSDDVYVSARQSAGGTSTEVSVTYEVTDHITVESTLEPTGTQDVSVNYKKDY